MGDRLQRQSLLPFLSLPRPGASVTHTHQLRDTFLPCLAIRCCKQWWACACLGDATGSNSTQSNKADLSGGAQPHPEDELPTEQAESGTFLQAHILIFQKKFQRKIFVLFLIFQYASLPFPLIFFLKQTIICMKVLSI